MSEAREGLLTEINIGVVGHVDHGKTSLVQALTGKWSSTYSEELKRGITIRLGYADATFYECSVDGTLCPGKKCPKCFEETKPLRAVSFVDAPGHETLMATVLSGASLMDGALLVISAQEKCPQPQTAEHLKAVDIAGIKNIVIVQNKIDLVSEQRAMESYREIKEFVKGTVAESAPIIPVSALHNANIDALIAAIQACIPTPQRDSQAAPRFYVARSFDVNRPGTPLSDLKGGVLGGSLTQGVIKVDDEIEIVPGPKIGDAYKTITTHVKAIVQAGSLQQGATPGGLVALQTTLDPALTRGDVLTGNIAGLAGKLPACSDKIRFKTSLFDYIIGVEGQQAVAPIRAGEVLMITAAIAKSVGLVSSASQKGVEMKLKIPVCVEAQSKIALARQVGGRWHLIGYGEMT